MFKKGSKAKGVSALAFVVLFQSCELLLVAYDYDARLDGSEAEENCAVNANKAIDCMLLILCFQINFFNTFFVLLALFERICEACGEIYRRSDSQMEEKCK